MLGARKRGKDKEGAGRGRVTGAVPWRLAASQLSLYPNLLDGSLQQTPAPRVSHSEGGRWGPKCISDTFPGDTRAVGMGQPFESRDM